MIQPRCLIARDAGPPLFPECFAGHLKWFHGRPAESARALGSIGRHHERPGEQDSPAGFLESGRGCLTGGRSRAIRPCKAIFIWQAILAAQQWLFPSP
jgi:hypothetical protein